MKIAELVNNYLIEEDRTNMSEKSIVKKKGNIFVFWGNFPPAIGGGSSRGYRIYKELASRGHEIKVFVGKLPGTSFHEQAQSKKSVIFFFIHRTQHFHRVCKLNYHKVIPH